MALIAASSQPYPRLFMILKFINAQFESISNINSTLPEILFSSAFFGNLATHCLIMMLALQVVSLPLPGCPYDPFVKSKIAARKKQFRLVTMKIVSDMNNQREMRLFENFINDAVKEDC